MNLGSFDADVSYLAEFGRFISSQGFQVTLADVTEYSGESFSWCNEVPIEV